MPGPAAMTLPRSSSKSLFWFNNIPPGLCLGAVVFCTKTLLRSGTIRLKPDIIIVKHLDLMASLISTCVKPPSPDDYCVDLRASQSLLISGFNSSNTIQVYSLPSLQLSSIYSTNSLGVLSEIAQYEENSIFWADRRGNIGLVDLCTMTLANSLSTNEEIFSIDSSGYNLAVASDKRITIYDIRNFQEKKDMRTCMQMTMILPL